MSTFVPVHRQILQAAMSNDVQCLERLRQTNPNLHWRNCVYPKSGDSPLHTASREGRIAIIRFLCEEWVLDCKDPNVTNLDGKTSLHEAAQFSQAVVVQYLLSKGADVNAVKRGDWTPLMLACTRTGSAALDTIKLLVDNGASLLWCNKDGWTAFHIAAREGDSEIVAYLSRSNSKAVNIKSKNGRSPLHTATLYGREDVVKILLTLSPGLVNEEDSCGATPVIEAARAGHEHLLTLLLDTGARLDAADKAGMGCVHYAAQAGSLTVLAVLLSRYTNDVNKQAGSMAVTPLHCAARASQHEAVGFLLQQGADPRLRDASGRSVLDVAQGPYKEKIADTLNRWNNPGG